LSVANSGDPIPSEAMHRLFQPFYRVSSRDSRQGLGLGLYIASEIARAHGGTISVTSSPEETRFTFRMPLH
jgi:sigma-B regulation protein RsbU (phosphoserine phosphatase)